MARFQAATPRGAVGAQSPGPVARGHAPDVPQGSRPEAPLSTHDTPLRWRQRFGGKGRSFWIVVTLFGALVALAALSRGVSLATLLSEPIWLGLGILGLISLALLMFLWLRGQEYKTELERLQRSAEASQRKARKCTQLMCFIADHVKRQTHLTSQSLRAEKADAPSDVRSNANKQARGATAELRTLADGILDVSNILSGKPQDAPVPVAPDRLATYISSVLEPACTRSSTHLKVVRPRAMTRSLSLDLRRFGIIVEHVAWALLDASHGGKMIVRFAHDGASLNVLMDVVQDDAAKLDSETSPHILIAREIVEAAGATLKVVSGMPRSALEIPAPIIECDPNLVVIETSSEARRLVLRAALLETGCEEWKGDDDRARVCAIVLDATGTTHLDRIEGLRRRFPSAVVLGIGDVNRDTLLDGHCSLPEDLSQFQAYVRDAHHAALTQSGGGIHQHSSKEMT